MKQFTKIFQALLGVAALIFTAIIAAGRLAWRKICNWRKNRSKRVRRVLTAILTLISVGFAAIVAYAYYDNKYGKSYWDEKELSQNIEAHYFRDGKYRVYNKLTKKYITPKINWVSNALKNDSLAVYSIPNRRGYINVNTGRIIIAAETNNYRKAWVFSEGLAAVMKDGKIGFINAQNEIVIPYQFDYSVKINTLEFGYVFHNGYCIMTNETGNFGLIDKSGNWVIEPSFDEIWTPHTSGYRVIANDGMYGILDSKCDVVYSTEYDYIEIVTDGFVLNKDGRKWQVDFEGNIVQPFMYDATYYISYPIGYDECGEIQYAFADFVKYEVMESYGIMNRITGEPITPAIYSDINMLSKELFEVQEYDSNNWYVLDTKGNVVPPM